MYANNLLYNGVNILSTVECNDGREQYENPPGRVVIENLPLQNKN